MLNKNKRTTLDSVLESTCLPYNACNLTGLTSSANIAYYITPVTTDTKGMYVKWKWFKYIYCHLLCKHLLSPTLQITANNLIIVSNKIQNGVPLKPHVACITQWRHRMWLMAESRHTPHCTSRSTVFEWVEFFRVKPVDKKEQLGIA